MKICFDYGHGGRDSGAAYKGRRESIDNLDIGRKVAREVKLSDLQVGEIRKDDRGISLRERVDFANKGDYDYFISFHRNAFRPERARGAEVFIHPQASPKAGKLAREIQNALGLCGFRNRGVKLANFYVLRKTKMPALLLEIGFIDNSQDNNLFDEKKMEIVKRISEIIKLGNYDK